MAMSESEKVIRTLYQITNNNHKGFAYQVNRLLELGCERFGLDIGILSKIDGDQYEVKYKVCPDNIPLNQGDRFELGETYCSITLEAKQPVGIEHVKKSEKKTHPAYKKFALESYIGVPLTLDGKLYGTLNFSSPLPSKRKFKNIDIDALQLMASWVSTELSRLEYIERLKQVNAQLEELATKDSLTSLHNRRSFQINIEQYLNLSKRTGSPTSLIILDVDKFKDYNDSYGHLEGDNILIELAGVLLQSCRSSDIVARFGGEEFAILLPNTDQAGALRLSEIVQHNLAQHSWLRQKITASFGIATTAHNKNDNKSTLEIGTEMIRQADSALYYSKEHGRDQINHFNNLQLAQDTKKIARA